MRTRALHTYIDDTGKKHVNVVWFGSTGIKRKGYDNAVWDVSKYDNDIGEAVFYDDKKNSFAEKQQSVIDSLTQRLSIIKGELWYSVKYGLPLFEKTRTKVEFDTFVLNTITRHPDVESVISFSSLVDNRHYKCSVKIQSVYGPIDVNI